MASPDILNFDRLLAPISSAENPCGADLRWEPLYQQVKDARPKVDRDAFGLDDPATIDWNPVLDLCVEALESRSKDLMLAAWLSEALVNLHGFSGFRDGLKLINGLLETFWDGLYPRPDGDDLEPRAAPLIFLTASGRGAMLPNVLREAPLTPDREEIFSYNYWRARQPMDKEPAEVFAQRAAEVEEKTRCFDEAVARMDVDFARRVFEDIEQARAELARFNQLLTDLFGEAAPGTTALRTALEECGHRARIILKDKGGFDAAESDEEASAAGENGQAASPGRAGPIQSREEAFRRLAEVAAYLRQKEPQNPIYLLVERAVLWSRLPFEQLLVELVKDSGARYQVGELLGIKPPEGS